jgi:Sugar (and other) transporter
MASQTQNVANSIVQQFFPIFMNNKGFYCFYLFFAVNLCLALFVWFLVPETRNVTLEEIDVLFGGANHVDKGGDLLGVEDHRHASVSAPAGGPNYDGKENEIVHVSRV